MQRRHVVTNHPDIRELKERFLHQLRAEGIHVLAKGAIEDYYPPKSVGVDKPSAALDACTKIVSRESALAVCDSIYNGTGKSPEIEVIFRDIFESVA